MVTRTYRHIGPSSGPEPQDLRLDTLTIEKMCDLVGLDAAARAPFLSGKCYWFANGFQSWSRGWEIAPGERPAKTRIMKVLELYTQPDNAGPRRGELLAHGIAYIRAGERFLAVVSHGGGAPIRFRIDRGRGRITIDADAAGCAFDDGEKVAEVTVFSCAGFFPLSDALAGIFHSRARFARADFLRAPGDRFLLAGGWESWYNHYTHIDEPLILENLEALDKSPNLIREGFSRKGRPVIFQVDDGWQRSVGDWEADPMRFPSGMKVLAEKISARGYVPGLWLAPFLASPRSTLCRGHPTWLLRTQGGAPRRAGWNPGWGGDFFCLNLSLKEVRDYLVSLFDTIIDDWGFRYLKLDFLYAGLLHGKTGAGPAWKWYREALEPIVSIERSRGGHPIAFLGCGAPLEASIGLFPLMRIGADTRETWDYALARLAGHEGRPSAVVNLRDTLGRAFMNRAIYLSDSDVVFMRSSNCALAPREKELSAAAALMFSSQLMISDDVSRFDGGEEAAITGKTFVLLDALAGREYGALQISRDLWRCFSRDGDVRGIVNLRSRSVSITAELCSAWRLEGEPLTFRSLSSANGIVIEPRSISLWRG